MADKINIRDLVPMDLFLPAEPIKIDIVYADGNHSENIFKEALYRKDARLSLHKDLARIVVAVAREIQDQYGFLLILKDGLRSIEAEETALNTDIIKRNPQWLEGPNVLFSKPGSGAHPRGMAIDISVEDADGHSLDMGTAFDEMTQQSARDYKGFSEDVFQNRAKLELSFVTQARKLNLPMLPLPSEWWDFRFPRAYYEQWQPLSDNDLPAPLRMVAPHHENHTNEWPLHFDNLVKEVLNSL